MQIRYRRELPDLMRQLDLPMIAAEIGVAEGLHSADLMRNGVEVLFMVDVWERILEQKGDGGSPQDWHDWNYQSAMHRVAEFGYNAVPLKGFSHEQSKHVRNNYLGLVYLDGDHSYLGVKIDLEAWFPKLVKGGIMAGHDFLAPEYGVKKAVEDFCNSHPNEVSKIYLLLEDKSEDAGFYFFKL